MTSDQLRNDLWAAISKDVAVMLWGAPTRETVREIRWGCKGSKSLEKETGYWYDFESDRGGGVLELVEIERQTDRRGAIQWLKDIGFVDDRPSDKRNKGRSGRGISTKYRTMPDWEKMAQKPKDDDTFRFAQKLWAESEQIGGSAEHPFRAWARSRNLLHPFCTVPEGIRWHGYRGGVIVCGVFPLVAWGKDGQPKGEPVAVQLLAIDQHGKKRYVLGPNKDRDKCDYGQVSEGVFILGDPNSDRVNIVEGIADALAVYSRKPGAMLATLGTSATLQHKAGVINWLTTKETWLYPDNDEAGDKGAAVLIYCIKRKSPDAKVVKVIARAFEDPGQWAEKQPLSAAERYDFDEMSGIFFDSGLAWGEADRMAIQTLMGRKSNER